MMPPSACALCDDEGHIIVEKDHPLGGIEAPCPKGCKTPEERRDLELARLERMRRAAPAVVEGLKELAAHLEGVLDVAQSHVPKGEVRKALYFARAALRRAEEP